MHYYRVAKADIKFQEQEKAKAQKAKLRFDTRQERLAREEQERLEKHRKASEARKKKQAVSGDQDKIAAALARVAKKNRLTTQTLQPVRKQQRLNPKLLRYCSRQSQKAAAQASTDAAKLTRITQTK